MCPLLQLATRLREMPAEEFSTHVEELCKARLEKPKRLREVVSKDWREIDDGTLRWVGVFECTVYVWGGGGLLGAGFLGGALSLFQS